MSCKDLKGEALKKCQAKEAKAKEAKAKEAAKDARIASLEKSVVDLNAANFRNKDVMKWEERKNRSGRRTAGSGTGLRFGGNTTRLQRKKNNRSQRGKRG
jgi:hypothetical protein